MEKKTSPINKPQWPWAKMDIVEVAEAAAMGKIWSPNSEYIAVDLANEWHTDLGQAENTELLWINSLVSAHACLEAAKINENHIQTAYKILRSYLDSYQNGIGVFSSAWKDEHAVANRLYVLTAFLHESCTYESKKVTQTELINNAHSHAIWLADEKNYVKNNHGVMMDLALAQFAIFISEIDNELSKKYINTAISRLEMMLKTTFDKDGCCTENSTTYHFVNYALFKSIDDFFTQYRLPLDYDKWEEVLKKAFGVGKILLRSDRTLPMIGDSESLLSSFFPVVDESGKTQIGYYPEAGMFSYKKNDFTFTMRAGGQNFVHRHVDDCSITVWAQNRDFIIDSGLYNYNASDKLRRWFISTRAHSGFYLESEGHVLFRNYNTPTEMSNFKSAIYDQDGFEVSAAHNLSAEAEVVRDIIFKENIISIVDKFESDKKQKWRAQYIFHPDVSITEAGGGKFILNNNGEELCLLVKNENINYSFENSYFSPKFMTVLNTKALVIKGESLAMKLQVNIIF